ncbi:transmembrane protein, putative [Medicago truncatula]|uniref:Transmembrane protein, putative n=1 Tax=Medicago truncatula TaxID=3880 RepID=G7IIT7_MEDTR|nr:transmembrane protein, putative [Medicago truncatula]
MKSFVPVVMAGVLGIYGLIIAVIISVIMVLGCQAINWTCTFRPLISLFFLGKGKRRKTLEFPNSGVGFTTGRC